MHTYYALVVTFAASTVFTPTLIGLRARTNALSGRIESSRS